jgi:hypothetical protein
VIQELHSGTPQPPTDYSRKFLTHSSFKKKSYPSKKNNNYFCEKQHTKDLHENKILSVSNYNLYNLMQAKQKQKKGVLQNITSHVTNLTHEINASEVAMRVAPYAFFALLSKKKSMPDSNQK